MPSLYWALVDRPRPFIDLSPALEGERFLLENEIPQLRELDGIPWSVEKARAFSDELQTKLFGLAGMAPGSGRGWSMKLGVAASVVQAYPEAKRALIAQGRSAAVIEAMPTVQVAALYTFQSYQEYRDDIFKWMGLPYYQAYKGMDASSRSRNAELQRRPLLKLFTMSPPLTPVAFTALVPVGSPTRCPPVYRGDPDLCRDPSGLPGPIGRHHRDACSDRPDDRAAVRIPG